MKRAAAARCLAELGNLTRLDIYRLLVRAGPKGLIITRLQTRLDVPLSTLTFHLRGLVNAGLVSQEKVGREVTCRAVYQQLDTLIDFLREECCKGFEDEASTLPVRRAS